MKIATVLLTCAIGVTGLAVHNPSQAQSLPPLACTVFPAGTANGCTTNEPSSEYSIRMQVPNPQVTSYVWAYTDINKGVKHSLSCTTSVCNVSTGAGGHDIDWAVTAQEIGRNGTEYGVDVDIPAVCGGGSYFC